MRNGAGGARSPGRTGTRRPGAPARGTRIAVPFGNDFGLLSDPAGLTDKEAKQSGRNSEPLPAHWPAEVEVPGQGWAAGEALRYEQHREQWGDGPAPKAAMKNAKMQVFDEGCKQ